MADNTVGSIVTFIIAALGGGLGVWVVSLLKVGAENRRINAEADRIQAEGRKAGAEADTQEADAGDRVVKSAAFLVEHYERRLAQLEEKVGRMERRYDRAIAWIRNAVEGIAKLHTQVRRLGEEPVYTPPEFKEDE